MFATMYLTTSRMSSTCRFVAKAVSLVTVACIGCSPQSAIHRNDPTKLIGQKSRILAERLQPFHCLYRERQEHTGRSVFRFGSVYMSSIGLWHASWIVSSDDYLSKWGSWVPPDASTSDSLAIANLDYFAVLRSVDEHFSLEFLDDTGLNLVYGIPPLVCFTTNANRVPVWRFDELAMFQIVDLSYDANGETRSEIEVIQDDGTTIGRITLIFDGQGRRQRDIYEGLNPPFEGTIDYHYAEIHEAVLEKAIADLGVIGSWELEFRAWIRRDDLEMPPTRLADYGLIEPPVKEGSFPWISVIAVIIAVGAIAVAAKYTLFSHAKPSWFK